jgi:molybdopterin molybdotransferase
VSDSQTPSLSLDDAVRDALLRVGALDAEHVTLREAVGRALASDVHSPIDLPRWNNSGMDGYAVIREDVAGANVANPVVLPVATTIVAGSDEAPQITRGLSARIMTGAPMPPGAEAVVRVEDTDRGVHDVRITNDRDVRSVSGNIRLKGGDMRAGELVFPAHTSVTPVHVGVLASVGVAMAHVFRRPRVTVVSTGDELVAVEHFDEVLAGRRIVSSSSYALPSWLEAQGALVRTLPLLADDLNEIRNVFAGALADGCDLLVTTGGVSVGAHDYTRDALRELGADMATWRARIRPGGPIGVGRIGRTAWLGLPGNPVSTMVTAELFARPLLRALGGHRRLFRTPIRVRLATAVTTTVGLTHMLRVVVSRAADGMLEATPSSGQASNQLRAMALANALLIVPETRSSAEPGDVLDALLTGDIQ